MPYGTLQDRVRRKSLLSKVMKAEETVQFFKNGMNLGWSGFTPAGYPKVVPIALAEHVEKNNLQGKLKFKPMDMGLAMKLPNMFKM